MRERTPRAPHLKWWHGALGLLLGGVGGQVAGILALLVAMAVWVVATGNVDPTGIEAMQAEILENLWIIGPSVFATGLTMALVAFGMPLLAGADPKRALGLKGAPWPVFVAGPIGILAFGPSADGMRQLMERYLPSFTFDGLEGLDALARSGPVWVILPLMALVPGICEELLFRGMFQRSIRRPVVAIVLSALLFALIHADPHHVAAVLPLGFYLAWLGHRTDGVTVPIVAHVTNNAAAVVGSRYLVDPLAGEPASLEWWWIPVGWAVGAAAVAVIWRSTRAPGRSEPAEVVATLEPSPVPVPTDPGE